MGSIERAGASSRVRSRVLLGSLLGGGLAVVAGELLVLAHARSGIGQIYGFWLEPLLSNAIFLVVGVLLVVRRPGHTVTVVFVANQVLSGAQALLGGYAHWASSGPSAPLPGAAWSGLFATWAQILAVVSWFLILYLVPNVRLPSRRWRWPFAALLVAVPVNLLLDGTQATTLDIGGMRSPLAVTGFDEARSILSLAIAPLLGIGLISGAVAPFARYRQATGIERAQLRMLAFGTAAGIGIVLVTSFPVFGEVGGSIAWGVGPAMLPASAGLAIIRYRLFDIDHVVSRTLAYAIVVAFLGAMYAAVVIGLGLLLPTGSGDLVVAGATLAVAAAFRPVRDRVRWRIDRRFNRTAFDTREALGRFTARVRDEVQLDRLLDALAETARSTLEPTTVSIWLAAPGDQGSSRPAAMRAR